MLNMKKHVMPYRLREFLPVFAPYGSKFADQIQGLAEFLSKQPRTVEAYLSTREDRTISADDYMRVAVEWVIRKSKSSLEPQFVVFDVNGDYLYETQQLWQARFLADVEGGMVHYRGSSGGWPRYADEKMNRRSRLRQLVQREIVSREEICEVFNFDKHCLVDHQLEYVDWLSTPDEFRLSALEALARERMEYLSWATHGACQLSV